MIDEINQKRREFNEKVGTSKENQYHEQRKCQHFMKCKSSIMKLLLRVVQSYGPYILKT
jgi:hypothetical protein